MFDLLFRRPLMTLLAVAGTAILAPVIFPVLGVILKPLVKPVTNLYLDIAEEMGEVVEVRERHKACKAAQKKLAAKKGPQGEEAREIEAGTAILDKVEKFL